MEFRGGDTENGEQVQIVNTAGEGETLKLSEVSVLPRNPPHLVPPARRKPRGLRQERRLPVAQPFQPREHRGDDTPHCPGKLFGPCGCPWRSHLGRNGRLDKRSGVFHTTNPEP